MKVAAEKPIILSADALKGNAHTHSFTPNVIGASVPTFVSPTVNLSVYQHDMLYIKAMLDELRKDMGALIERMDEFEERDA